MKKHIHYLAFAMLSLFFTSCTKNDDEFFASTIVTSNNIIELNAAGNELNVAAYFPRIITQLGTNPFDVYLTSDARKFFFNMTLEKRNASGNWEPITPTLISNVNGEEQVGDYISCVSTLNALDTTFEYESFITLNPGDYRVVVDPELVSINPQDAVMVTIKTTVVGYSSGIYEFTVN